MTALTRGLTFTVTFAVAAQPLGDTELAVQVVVVLGAAYTVVAKLPATQGMVPAVLVNNLVGGFQVIGDPPLPVIVTLSIAQ